MGLLVDGKWYDDWENSAENDGRKIRTESQFRSWITPDGSAGPTGRAGFRAKPNRYHLYVAYACPWAHRALIMRKLKGLEDLISVSVVSPNRTDKGWTFEQGEGVVADPVVDADYLYEVYAHADPSYSGKVTVPVLYDLEQNQIVNNESADILRMLNTAFDQAGANDNDYYPKELRSEIDQLNDEILTDINNRVYKASYSSDPMVAEVEEDKLYQALEKYDEHLEQNRYLTGDLVTESDWRLFVTLIRFDPVYHRHFKSDRKRIEDFKNLSRYTKELYNIPGIADTINFDHMKQT